MEHLPTFAAAIKRKYFPELSRTNTPLEYQEGQMPFIDYKQDQNEANLFHFKVNPSLGNAPSNVLTGGLSYQLAKIVSSIVPQRKNLWQKIFGSGPEEVENPDYQKSPEEIVRERGLGEQLDKFLAYSSLPRKNP